MDFQVAELVIALITGVGALMVATATLVWFISEQFKKNRNEFWKAITSLHNTITEKLDDHETKDDRRFNDLTNQVWGIEVKIAQRHGERVPDRPRMMT